MRRAIEKTPVYHRIFGKGVVTATDEHRVRVRFEELTGGIRVRELPHEELTEAPAPTLADDMYDKRILAPDKTAAERCFHELLVGKLHNHNGLQRRAWKGLMKIARMATKGMYLPQEKTGFLRHKYSGTYVPDGGAPAAESIAAQLIAEYLQNEDKLQPRFFGRKVRQTFHDEIRKQTAKKRQPPVLHPEDIDELTRQGIMSDAPEDGAIRKKLVWDGERIDRSGDAD